MMVDSVNLRNMSGVSKSSRRRTPATVAIFSSLMPAVRSHASRLKDPGSAMGLTKPTNKETSEEMNVAQCFLRDRF